MKKAILIFLCLALTGCAKETKNYAMPGYYFDNGTVITDDGNMWGYQKEIHNCPVHVIFNDNGTADNIYDDIIIDLIEAK